MSEVREEVRTSRRHTVGRLFDSERFRWGLVATLLLLLVAAVVAYPYDRDTFWEARAGIENLNGVALARRDSWSWSATGVWYPNSPLWNVVLGLAWQGLGFWGLFWVGFASCAVLVLLLLVAARRLGGDAFPTFAVSGVLIVIGSATFSARATVPVLALLAASALFASWWGPRAVSRGPVVASTVLALTGFAISLTGNWIHLSFLAMSAAIALMWAVAWWFTAGLDLRKRLWMAAGGTIGLFLGCVSSPYGIPLTIERSRAVSEACAGIITEWMSLPTAFQVGRYPLGLVIVLSLVVSLLAAAWLWRLIRRHGRFDARTALSAQLVVIAVPAGLAGLGAARFMFIAMLLSVPVLAAAATELRTEQGRRRAASGRVRSARVAEYTSARFWTLVWTAVTIALIPVVAVFCTGGTVPPEARLAPRLPVGCALFSDAGSAGLVLLVRPDVKVWVDGRADFYGHARLVETADVVAGRGTVPQGANCVMAPLKTEDGAPSPFVRQLDHDRSWSRIATGADHGLWTRVTQ